MSIDIRSDVSSVLVGATRFAISLGIRSDTSIAISIAIGSVFSFTSSVALGFEFSIAIRLAIISDIRSMLLCCVVVLLFCWAIAGVALLCSGFCAGLLFLLFCCCFIIS